MRDSTAKERLFEVSAMQIVNKQTCEGINCMRCPLMSTEPNGECTDGGGERDHSQAAADWLITNAMIKEREGMKVVINKRFGGFGLSEKAEKLYLSKKGLDQFLYMDRRDEAGNMTTGFVRATGDYYLWYTFTKDKGDSFEDFPKEDYFYDKNIPRDDIDLVAVVNELGSEANGRYAGLTIVEIPDGVDWEIDDYDGMESVSEKHRSWS